MWQMRGHRMRWRLWRWVRWGRRVAAAGLFLSALLLLLGDPAPAESPGTVAVLVAARDLPLGVPLSPGDLRSERYPLLLAPDGAITPGDDPVGGVLAAPLRAGEPLTDVRLLGSGLTSALRPGETAVPVRLSDAGVAPLLRPGDRIDLYAVGIRGAPGSDLVAAHTLVLAIPTDADSGDRGVVPEGGIVMVSADRTTAARLLESQYAGALAATLSPP